MKAEEAPACREQPGTTTGTAPGPGAGIPMVCSGCHSLIRDRFLLWVDGSPWHELCLRCCRCSRPLRGRCFCRERRLYCRPDYQRSCSCSQPLRGRCFCRERRLYCRPDYQKLFGARCGRCRARLGRSEPVLRVLRWIFHPRCLRCISCERRLRRGDEFVLKGGSILCTGKCDRGGSEADEGTDSQNSQNSQNSRHSRHSRQGPRRARTVLSPEQRRAFRASFQISAKPGRKVRESLAAELGLTVRVVQVWFQNQRAKMKKLARRQQQPENSRGEIPAGNEEGEVLQPLPGFFRIPAPPPEPPGTFRPYAFPAFPASVGIFQEPPGAALGSLGEENSREPRLGEPRIPEFPGIPEVGNPIARLCSMHSSYFSC